MKKLQYLFIIFFFLLAGCSKDFLERIPEGSVTTGSFYKTEDQFNQALVGTYAAVRTVKGSIAAWTMGEMRADNTYYEYNVNNRGLANQHREDIDGFLDDNGNSLVAEYYNNSYTGIARANNIIDQISKAGLKQDVTDKITGQSKFIRALLYFDLVRYFGRVSLYLKSVNSAETAYLPRASVAEVYQAIETDLKEAIQKLPAATFPQNGTATKGAAYTLLGDVYLTQKKYDLAEQQFLEVTKLGYGLLDDYPSVYKLTNKNSKESIFELQYQKGNQGQQSNFLYPFLPLSANVSLITEITSQNNNGGGWNVPTQEFINSYEAGDQRLAGSVGIAEGTGPVGAMVIQAVKSPVGYVKPANKRAYAFIKKYLHAHSLENNTDDNFPVYRYAEVLLSLAESLNEQNKSGDALKYVNKIRFRAGLLDTHETDQIKLREIIAHERRVELAFENKRWLDLVRTGKALEVMKLHSTYIKSIDPHLLPQSYNINQERLIYAIPQREVLIGGLEQNLGYN